MNRTLKWVTQQKHNAYSAAGNIIYKLIIKRCCYWKIVLKKIDWLLVIVVQPLPEVMKTYANFFADHVLIARIKLYILKVADPRKSAALLKESFYTIISFWRTDTVVIR